MAVIRTTVTHEMVAHEGLTLTADDIGRFYLRHVTEDEHGMTQVTSYADNQGRFIRLELVERTQEGV